MERQQNRMTLTRLKPGQTGTVIDILGGRSIHDRLCALGIHRGKKVTKVSSMYLHGPVVVDLQHSKIALGFNLADKVVVEVEH
ncbi:MAG: FeoA family protein [Bacillota bacterium]